jgi:hypothetical protein
MTTAKRDHQELAFWAFSWFHRGQLEDSSRKNDTSIKISHGSCFQTALAFTPKESGIFAVMLDVKAFFWSVSARYWIRYGAMMRHSAAVVVVATVR